MNIGERIHIKRKEKKLTLEELGERTGMTRYLIHKYEKGIISNIPSDKIEKLAIALSTTPAYLMGWEGIKESVTKEGNLSKSELAILEEIGSLSEKEREDLLSYIKWNAERKGSK